MTTLSISQKGLLELATRRQDAEPGRRYSFRTSHIMSPAAAGIGLADASKWYRSAGIPPRVKNESSGLMPGAASYLVADLGWSARGGDGSWHPSP
jgi:hypothetical protein